MGPAAAMDQFVHCLCLFCSAGERPDFHRKRSAALVRVCSDLRKPDRNFGDGRVERARSSTVATRPPRSSSSSGCSVMRGGGMFALAVIADRHWICVCATILGPVFSDAENCHAFSADIWAGSNGPWFSAGPRADDAGETFGKRCCDCKGGKAGG